MSENHSSASFSKYWFSADPEDFQAKTEKPESRAYINVAPSAPRSQIQDEAPPPPSYPVREIEPAEPSETPRSPPFLDRFVNFLLDHWKIIIMLGSSAILFFMAFFLVLFMVILKPTTHTTQPPPVLVANSIMSPTTVISTRHSTMASTMKLNSTVVMTTMTSTVRTTTMKAIAATTMTTKKWGPYPTVAPNTICTNNFKLVNNKCLKLVDTPGNRASADQTCRGLAGGAALVSINSQDENQVVSNFLNDKNLKKIWIGMECDGNFKSNCTWDNGRGKVEYSNFVKGFPNIAIGSCVYFLTSEGRWASGDCDLDQMPFVCELPTTTEDYCEYNYNNNCYFRIDRYMTFDEAETECKALCAHSVSIHSELENQYVFSIRSGCYSVLGGMAPSTNLVIWNDGSARQYTNFKSIFENGICVQMNIHDATWYTTYCDIPSYAICKRRAGMQC